MNQARRIAVQVVLAAALSSTLALAIPGVPAEQLGSAVNYTYQSVLAEISRDGLP